jgi:hypothetical protein
LLVFCFFVFAQTTVVKTQAVFNVQAQLNKEIEGGAQLSGKGTRSERKKAADAAAKARFEAKQKAQGN